MPERIQLRRAKGWRKPEGAVIVARPTKWGNPFLIGSTIQISGSDADGLRYETGPIAMTREMSIAAYRDLVTGRMDTFGSIHPDDVTYCREWRVALAELRGHDLACWCRLDEPCHADVLLELANSPP